MKVAHTIKWILVGIVLVAIMALGVVASSNGTLCGDDKIFSKGVCIGKDGVSESKIFKSDE